MWQSIRFCLTNGTKITRMTTISQRVVPIRDQSRRYFVSCLPRSRGAAIHPNWGQCLSLLLGPRSSPTYPG